MLKNNFGGREGSEKMEKAPKEPSSLSDVYNIIIEFRPVRRKIFKSKDSGEITFLIDYENETQAAMAETNLSAMGFNPLVQGEHLILKAVFPEEQIQQRNFGFTE